MKSSIFRSFGTVLFFLLVCTSVMGQQNPFLSGSSSESPSSEEAPAPAGESDDEARETKRDTSSAPEKTARPGGAQGPLRQHITSLQRVLYSHIAGLMNDLKSSGKDPRFLLMLLLGACVYGMLHALGPGHRKTVIFSYFLAEDAQLLRGILAGVAMALLHGTAAVGIILPLYYLVKGSLLVTFNSVSRYIELGTFLFIALFGAVMFLLHLFPYLKKNRSDAHEMRGAKSAKSPRRSHGLLLLIVGSGLVPCPGAAMILMFALSLDMVSTGLLAVAAMSIGMAITLSLVAIISLGARGGLDRGTRRNRNVAAIVHLVLELGGYGLITVFGLVMAVALWP